MNAPKARRVGTQASVLEELRHELLIAGAMAGPVLPIRYYHYRSNFPYEARALRTEDAIIIDKVEYWAYKAMNLFVDYGKRFRTPDGGSAHKGLSMVTACGHKRDMLPGTIYFGDIAISLAHILGAPENPLDGKFQREWCSIWWLDQCEAYYESHPEDPYARVVCRDVVVTEEGVKVGNDFVYHRHGINTSQLEKAIAITQPYKTTIRSASTNIFRFSSHVLRAIIQGEWKPSTAMPQDVEVPLQEDDSGSDISVGEWLTPPVSLAELGRRLNPHKSQKQALSKQNVHTILDPFGLRKFPGGNRQAWTVRLDKMPTYLRKQLGTTGSN